jgi:predicted ATPase
MELPAPRRIAIMGAPGAGKSVLLEALAARGWRTVPEAARAILQQAGGMALRRQDPEGFALAMLEAQRAAFVSVQPGETAIFDRGFCDIVAFLRIEGLPVPAEVEAACRSLRFEAPVLHAPAWRGIYRQDAERIQSWEEAVESDRQNLNAWRDYGYDPLSLPLLPVEDRAQWFERLLGF